MPNQFDFIAIEGVIGAGKTTLAQLLSERNNARLVLEKFEENPFLPKFYEDRKRYAFQTTTEPGLFSRRRSHLR